jgi:hypothetical protein
MTLEIPTPDTPVHDVAPRFDKWKSVGALCAIQTVTAYIGLGLLVGGWPPDLSYLTDPEYAPFVLLPLGIIFALQAVLVWPVRKPRPAARGGVSLWLSMGVAGLAVAAMVGGLLAAGADAAWLVSGVEPDERILWLIGGTMALAWCVTTPLLVGFCRRHRPESAIGRVSARLFLGTIVEVGAIIPLDVMVRRKTDCYCGQGTFFALILAWSVGLLAVGPAIFLPVLARRRKRWYAGHCEACGYDMAGTPAADRCPECGAGWKAE